MYKIHIFYCTILYFFNFMYRKTYILLHYFVIYQSRLQKNIYFTAQFCHFSFPCIKQYIFYYWFFIIVMILGYSNETNDFNINFHGFSECSNSLFRLYLLLLFWMVFPQNQDYSVSVPPCWIQRISKISKKHN